MVMASTQLLVTGATGFVGGHLVTELAKKGYSVTALVRKGSARGHLEELGIGMVEGNLEDPQSLLGATRGKEVVIHLAAYYTLTGKRALYEKVNVEGTRSLLEACLRNGTRRFIYCSSTEAIGPVEHPPAGEDSKPSPQNEYGRTKLKAEEIVKGYAARGLDYTILRPSGLYGPGNVNDVSYWFITAVCRNSLATRFIVGSGENLVQFTHVSDAVKGFVLALENFEVSRNQVYNICEEGANSYNEAYRILCGLSGRQPPHSHISPWLAKLLIAPVEGMNSLLGREDFMWHLMAVDSVTSDRYYSIEKARKELSFSPAYTLKSGLTETVGWYSMNGYL
jgi:nucleoside-diphosphate-sugar epimerase